MLELPSPVNSQSAIAEKFGGPATQTCGSGLLACKLHAMSRLPFITFEGSEACGKSTQLSLLAERIRAGGREVLVVREPGGCEIGEEIRQLLQFSKKGQGMHPRAELLLFNASRAQLVEEKILPALHRGAVVLSDRFADSTRVYQGAARGISPALIESVIAAATNGLSPSRTFLLDLSVEQARERLQQREGPPGEPDRFEQLPPEFYEKVRQGYLNLAAAEPGRFSVLDAALDKMQIAEKIWQTFTNDGFSS